MGIRIDGAADQIAATDGSLTIEGQSVNTTGIMTASGGVKVGTAATIHSTGQFNIGVAATIFAGGNATFAGIVTANAFVGDGSGLEGVVTGAGGTWAVGTAGISTHKNVGIGTTTQGVKGTVTGAAQSEGALQVHGNVSLYDGAIMTDKILGTNLQIPAGKNALLVGPVSVTTGIAVTVETNATLVII